MAFVINKGIVLDPACSASMLCEFQRFKNVGYGPVDTEKSLSAKKKRYTEKSQPPNGTRTNQCRLVG